MATTPHNFSDFSHRQPKPTGLVTLVAAALVSLTFSLPAVSEIYRSKNKAGDTVFSDIKTNNAEQIELPPLNTQSFPKVDAAEYQTTTLTHEREQEQPIYNSLLIDSPSVDQVIRSNSGNIMVSVSVAPALRENHKIQILIDGMVTSSTQSETHFELNEIDRGTHQLAAQIIDTSDGSTVITSPAIEIHIKRHSILN